VIQNSNKFFAMAIDVLLNRSKTVLVLFLAITAGLGSQASKFEIDASPDTLLTRDNILYTLTQEVNQQFSPQEFLLVTYAPRETSLFTEQTLANLRALSGKLTALDRVQSVRSILNVPLFGSNATLLNANIDLESLTIESGNYSLDEVEKEFTDHPIYTDLLVNEDKSAAALQVLFRSDPELAEIESRITTLNSKFQSAGLSKEQEQELQLLQDQAQPLRKALEQVRLD